MEEKVYLDKDDIKKIFGCGTAKAYSIIRSIRAYSDSLNLQGKVTRNDYLAWLNRPLKKDNASLNSQTESIVFQQEIR